MCSSSSSPFPQLWLDSYTPAFPPPPPSTRSVSSISPKTSIYGGPGGRRGAVVASEDSFSSLDQIRRGSISTILGNMNIQTSSSSYINTTHNLPVPIINPPLYCDSMLSPPSSPKSTPETLQSVAETQDTNLPCRKFQRQIMTKLQALNASEHDFTDEDRFTPPPSPGPESTTSAASPRSRLSSGGRKRSRNVSVTPVLANLARAGKGAGRRVSVPANVGVGGHTSARGAVKKASSASAGVSASSSRRGSERLEGLLEGGLFKSGWSWESAYATAALNSA